MLPTPWQVPGCFAAGRIAPLRYNGADPDALRSIRARMHTMWKTAIVPLLLALATGPVCARSEKVSEEVATPPAPDVETTLFEDITRSSGVDFEQPPSPDVKYIVEAANGGVALFDYNRDGLLDIYLVSPLTHDTLDESAKWPSALYENRGNGRFVDVARKVGVDSTGWGVGVCVADYDGDGFRDLYVTGLEANRLFRNEGGERFTDVAAELGVEGGGWSTGCTFADFDRDGDLDLFVSRYVTVSFDELPEFGKGQFCSYREMPVHCGPRGLPGISDLFFRNDGGHFVEVSQEAGVGDAEKRYGLGAVAFDADEDGWLDLFVANDTLPNYLYLNKKDGTFEEMGFLMGVAASEDGKAQGSMGVALGDYLGEGRISLFVTNFAEEYNTLYRNAGGFFTDESFRSGTALPSLRNVGWGTAFLDYDNDGWLDLLLVNGHVYPQVAELEVEAIAPYHQRRLLYRNRRDGTFEEIGEKVGGPLTEPRVSRGMAVGDLDNDGRLDVVINNQVGKAEVWRGVYPGAGNWLLVELVGAGKLTDAIGATVHLGLGKQRQMRLVQSGSNYLSQDDMRLHFGLGDASKIDTLEVRWPDGTTTARADVAVNQVLRIEQPVAESTEQPSVGETGKDREEEPPEG